MNVPFSYSMWIHWMYITYRAVIWKATHILWATLWQVCWWQEIHQEWVYHHPENQSIQRALDASRYSLEKLMVNRRYMQHQHKANDPSKQCCTDQVQKGHWVQGPKVRLHGPRSVPRSQAVKWVNRLHPKVLTWSITWRINGHSIALLWSCQM